MDFDFLSSASKGAAMLLSLDKQKEIAMELVREHKKAEPRLRGAFWFPDTDQGNEIRLLEALEGRAPEGKATMLQFAMNEYGNGVKMVIGDIAPGQKPKLPRLKWANWNNAQALWERHV
jgi:hypothetical protein